MIAFVERFGCAVMENPRTPEATLIRIAQGPIERYAVHARQCLEAR
jgi:hypothetical protein